VGVLCGVLAVAFKRISSLVSTRLVGLRGSWWHLIPIACGFGVALITYFSHADTTGGGIAYAQHVVDGTESTNFSELGARYANTILSLLSGGAGGMLAPSLAIGSGVGSVFSGFFPGLEAIPLVMAG